MEDELKEKKEEQYGDEDFLTSDDIGKQIVIITVKDRVAYSGKLTRIGKNQIEIENEDKYGKMRIIIYKPAIVSIGIKEVPK